MMRPAFLRAYCPGCRENRAVNENGQIRMHKGDNRGPISNTCSEGDVRADEWVRLRQQRAAKDEERRSVYLTTLSLLNTTRMQLG